MKKKTVCLAMEIMLGFVIYKQQSRSKTGGETSRSLFAGVLMGRAINVEVSKDKRNRFLEFISVRNGAMNVRQTKSCRSSQLVLI